MAKVNLDKETIIELRNMPEKDREKRVAYLKGIISMCRFEARSRWKREKAVAYTLNRKELKFLENLNRKRKGIAVKCGYCKVLLKDDEYGVCKECEHVREDDGNWDGEFRLADEI